MSDKKQSPDDSSREDPTYGTLQPPGPESSVAALAEQKPPGQPDGTKDARSTADAGRTHDDSESTDREDHASLSRTIRAGDAQLAELAGADMGQPPQPKAKAKTRRPDATILDSVPGREPEQSPGRSTWNLRIMQREVRGEITGVMNEVSSDPSRSTGLQSALVIDESVPAYEVVGKIGSGAMGNVYRATQTCLNRELAIKTLIPKPESDSEQDQAMFVSEAVVTANLVHPNIVPIHELGRTAEGKLFYSMKQVQGIAWNNVIAEKSLEENLDILLKVCDGVAFAHSRGVINRDLKPENVMVGAYGEVIVLDWGLAVTNQRFAKKNSVVVDFRGRAGTPLYMAPELMDKDIHRVQPGTDIYLLGAMLFEILEGRPPHLLQEFKKIPADDRKMKLQRALLAVVRNEIGCNVKNKGELMQISRRAMETQPEDRYTSVEEFQETIREYRITGRAEELMQKVEHKGSASYSEYQSAVALYGEALRKWPENQRALQGDKNARLGYAELARQKGDLDLGLQVVADQQDRRFAKARKKLRRAKRRRAVIRGTWGLMTVAAVLGALISTSQYFTLHSKHNELIAAYGDRDKALSDKKDALSDKQDAEKQKTSALRLRDVAIQKKDDAEEQKTAALRLRDDAIQKKDDAERAERKAFFTANKKLVQAAEEIYDYDAVLDRADKALQDKEVDLTESQKRVLSNMKKRALLQLKERGNTSAKLDGNVNRSATSPDGTSLVVSTERDTPGVIVFRGLGEKHIQLDDGHTLKRKASPVVDLAIADQGNVVSVISGDLKAASVHQLWKWNGSQYAEVVSETITGINPQCLLSPDGHHAYLLQSGVRNGTLTLQPATVTVSDTSGDRAEMIVRHQLIEDPNKGAPFPYIRDAVLLPNESAIIVATDANLRAIAVNWSEDGRQVEMPQQKFGDNRENTWPAPTGLDKLGEGNRTGRFGQLEISSRGSRLAVVDKSRVFVLDFDGSATSTDFPYSIPQDGTPVQEINNRLDASFDGNFSTVSFSADETQLVATTDRFIQLWTREAEGYRLRRSESLYNERMFGGHSVSVNHAAFLLGSNNRFISVDDGDTIRTWNAESYAEYVAGMKQLAEEFAKVFTAAQSADNAAIELQRGSRVVINKAASPKSDADASDAQRPDQQEFRVKEGAARTAFTKPSERLTRTSGPRYILTGGVQDQEPAKAIGTQQGRRVYSAEFSRDSQRVTVGADDLAAHTFESLTASKTASMSMQLPRDSFFAPDRNNFMEGHIPEIVSVKFLPPDGDHGDLLLTLDYFGSLSVWDASDDENGIGFEISRPLPTNPVLSEPSEEAYEVEDASCEITVSRDGRFVMAGGVRNDGNPDILESEDEFFVAIWKIDDIMVSGTPTPYRVLKNQHPARVTAAAFSPDGNLAITAGRRGHLVLWNFENQEVLATADGAHGFDQASGVFFVSETEFISTGFDGQVLRWTIEPADDTDQRTLTREPMPRGEGTVNPDYIIRLRPSPDGSGFITSDLKKGASPTDDAVRESESDRAKNSDRTSYNLTLNYWSSADGWQKTLPIEVNATADYQDKPYRHGISWSPDGEEVLFVNDERLVTIDPATWTTKQGYELPRENWAVRGAYAPTSDDSRRIATFDGRFAQLWDMANGEQVAEFRSHAKQVHAGFSADGRFLITASDSIRVFNAQEDDPNHGRPVFRMSREAIGRSRLSQAKFSPVERDYRFASIDVAGEVKLWNWNEGEGPPSQSAFESGPSEDSKSDDAVPCSICWSDDAKFLAACRMGKLSLWKFVDGQPQAIDVRYPDGMDRNKLILNDLDFSADGVRLLGGGIYDGKSYGLIWKVAEDQLIPVGDIDADAEDVHQQSRNSNERRNRLHGITCVAFDDTRDSIITGGTDGQVHRWLHSIEPGEFTASLHDGEITGSAALDDNFCGDDPACRPHTESISDVDVAPNGSFLTADEAGFFVIWPPDR